MLALHSPINRDHVTHLSTGLTDLIPGPSSPAHPQSHPHIVWDFVSPLWGVLSAGLPILGVALSFVGIHQTAAGADFQVRGRPQRTQLGLLTACCLRLCKWHHSCLPAG